MRDEGAVGPPALSERLLALLLPARDREAILGDLAEAHRAIVRERGRSAGIRWYRREVARSAVPALRRRLSGSGLEPLGVANARRRRGGLLEGGGQDVRLAVRTLTRRPVMSLVALVTVALGVGAATAVFGVVHGVLLRPLPYPEVDRLHYLWERPASGGRSWVSAPNFEDWRAGLRSFEGVAALTPSGFNAAGASGPERVSGVEVTPGYFRVLGIGLAHGRGFRPEEGRTPVAPVAVISHGLWQRQYGGDPAVVGRTLLLEDVPFQIVGVVPAGSGYPADAEVWLPLDLGSAGWKRQRGTKWLNVIARLRADVSMTAARAELAALSASLAAQHAELDPGTGIADVPFVDEVMGDVRTPLRILSGAVGLVLLVVCVNIAGLFLVRAAARRRESVIRLSLGGGRSRLARQFLTETVLLCTAGGAAGLLIAVWAVRILRQLAPAGTPRIEGAAVSGPVLLFGVALSLATGVVCGIVPALRETTMTPGNGLREVGTGNGRRGRSRRVVAGAQIALAVVLVVGAGHLLETFRQLRGVDPGFRSGGVLTAWLPLSETRYDTDPAVEGFYRDVLQRVRGLPGVHSAGVVSLLPLSGNATNFSFELRAPLGFDEDELVAGYQSASAGYFDAMRIPLLRGRPFRPGEGATDEPVIIVDEAFASRFFPEGDALDREILTAGDRWRRVVGVVGAVRRRTLRGEPEPLFYVPLGQDPRDAMTLVVRSGHDDPTTLAPAIRQVVTEVDATQPVASLASLQSLVDASIAQPRFTATVVGFFGLATLMLAMLAMYGAVSGMVERSIREVGIRMALGAGRGSVLRLVLGRGMGLAAAGLLVGTVAAFPAMRLLQNSLYGVTAFQLEIVAAVTLLMLAAAVLACWLPARRATRVDPARCLRWE